MRKWVLAITGICLLGVCAQEVIENYRSQRPDEALIIEAVVLPKESIFDILQGRGSKNAIVLKDSWWVPFKEKPLVFEGYLEKEIKHIKEEQARSTYDVDTDYAQKAQSSLRSLTRVRESIKQLTTTAEKGFGMVLRTLPLHGDIFLCNENELGQLYGKNFESKSGKGVEGLDSYMVTRPVFSKDRRFAYIAVRYSYEHFSEDRYVLERKRREWKVISTTGFAAQ